MDLQYFLNVLWKRKWLLLVVAVTAAVVTVILVGRTPYKFKSRAIIEAKLLESDRINPLNNNPFIQQYQVDIMFSELTEIMKSRRILKLLAEELLYHDLSADGINEKPFRLPEDSEELSYTRTELEEFMTVLSSTKDALDVPRIQKHNRIKFSDLAEAFEYDYESLWKDLEVKRLGDSDFLAVEFTSEHPGLSKFAVDKFCSEFMDYYDEEIVNSEDSMVTKFKKELEEKKYDFNLKTEELNAYREKKGIVDLEKQNSMAIERISELNTLIEIERNEIIKQKKALESSTREIAKISPEANNKFAKKKFLNEDLAKLQTRIKLLHNKFSASGRKDKKIALELDGLRKQRKDIATQIAVYDEGNDRLETSQLDALLKKKLDAEIDLNAAEDALNRYEKEKKRLASEQNVLVENDAVFKSLESEWLLVYDDYKSAKAKFDQAELGAGIQESPLRLFEAAEIPEKAESKNRAILGAFAGVAGGVLTTLFLFLAAFFDKSFSSPRQYQSITNLPFLGTVNLLKSIQLDPDSIFSSKQDSDEGLVFFKKAVRKLRFALETSKAKTFLVTSTKEGEGKSFLLLTLAYALSLNKRRVLLIDANFKNNSLSALSNISDEENPLLMQANGKSEGTGARATGAIHFQVEGVDLIGNAGDNRSASEILAGRDFGEVLRIYKSEYDYILIESSAMNNFNDTRELSQYTDKVILVSGANESLEEDDKESFAFLQSLGSKFLGAILNKVNLKNLD